MTYRTRAQAKADVFDYIERFYNPKWRHSTLGYLSPMEFEMKAGIAYADVNQTNKPAAAHLRVSLVMLHSKKYFCLLHLKTNFHCPHCRRQ
jgi:putative transposase